MGWFSHDIEQSPSENILAMTVSSRSIILVPQLLQKCCVMKTNSHWTGTHPGLWTDRKPALGKLPNARGEKKNTQTASPLPSQHWQQCESRRKVQGQWTHDCNTEMDKGELKEETKNEPVRVLRGKEKELLTGVLLNKIQPCFGHWTWLLMKVLKTIKVKE